MSIERFEGGMTIRPMSGLPRFKRTACVQLKNGTIYAINRWGKTCSFPLSGAENSPKRAGGAFNAGTDVWWLEDENARLLLVVEQEHFWPVELRELEQGAKFPMAETSDHMFPMRPDVFKISDLAIVNFGISCAGIGSVVVALRWLGVLPEWVMLTVALPALIAAVLCIGVNKLTGPKGEDKAHQDYLLTHMDEIFAEAEEAVATAQEGLEDYDPNQPPGVKTDPQTARPEQVDGG
jgi:hypothetical protein